MISTVCESCHILQGNYARYSSTNACSSCTCKLWLVCVFLFFTTYSCAVACGGVNCHLLDGGDVGCCETPIKGANIPCEAGVPPPCVVIPVITGPPESQQPTKTPTPAPTRKPRPPKTRAPTRKPQPLPPPPSPPSTGGDETLAPTQAPTGAPTAAPTAAPTSSSGGGSGAPGVGGTECVRYIAEGTGCSGATYGDCCQAKAACVYQGFGGYTCVQDVNCPKGQQPCGASFGQDGETFPNNICCAKGEGCFQDYSGPGKPARCLPTATCKKGQTACGGNLQNSPNTECCGVDEQCWPEGETSRCLPNPDCADNLACGGGFEPALPDSFCCKPGQGCFFQNGEKNTSCVPLPKCAKGTVACGGGNDYTSGNAVPNNVCCAAGEACYDLQSATGVLSECRPTKQCSKAKGEVPCGGGFDPKTPNTVCCAADEGCFPIDFKSSQCLPTLKCKAKQIGCGSADGVGPSTLCCAADQGCYVNKEQTASECLDKLKCPKGGTPCGRTRTQFVTPDTECCEPYEYCFQSPGQGGGGSTQCKRLPCKADTCKNGGRCIDTLAGAQTSSPTVEFYQCECKPGYSGLLCETVDARSLLQPWWQQ
jgi:EGF-like domain